MTNSHNCRSDHTVELVEQLQIRLPVENQTLEEESSTCEAVKIVDSFALFLFASMYVPCRWKGGHLILCLNINLDPVWIEDEDGSEEETKEGRRGVDKPNCRSGLQLYFTLNFYQYMEWTSLF